MFDLVVREAALAGTRVLDVGCGTGRLLRALAERSVARAWGVDPEPAMLDVAREAAPGSTGLKRGSAEALPFRDAWFDRVVFWLSVHLVDRPRALAEAFRVLGDGGRVVVVTFHPEHFEAHWLAPFLPSLVAIDGARFPTAEQLAEELPSPRLLRLGQRGSLSRDEALERLRGRYISTLDLVGPDELREATARAERELPERVETRLDWLVAIAPGGSG